MLDATPQCIMMGWAWGGVGMVTFGELAHMVDATKLCCLCPWTHARCYATMHHDGVGTVTFGELAHMVDATQLCCLCPWTHAQCYASPQCIMMGWGWLRSVNLHTWWMLLCCLCPWTHARCYATMHHDGVGMVTFGELAHMGRCSLDNPDPQSFLEELEKLL